MSGTPKFQLVLSPPSAHWHGRPLDVRLANAGNVALHVTTETMLLHGGCRGTVTTGVTVTPDSFTIPPGHGLTAVVTVPQGASGDFGVLFIYDRPTGSQGTVSKGIGFQVYDGAHVASCVPKKPPPDLVAHHPGFPVLPVAIIAAAVLAALAFAVARRGQRA